MDVDNCCDEELAKLEIHWLPLKPPYLSISPHPAFKEAAYKYEHVPEKMEEMGEVNNLSQGSREYFELLISIIQMTILCLDLATLSRSTVHSALPIAT